MIKLKSKLPSMIFVFLLALTMLVTSVSPALAFGTASVGSVAEDVEGSVIIGQDVDQGKQTEYWNDTAVDDAAIKSFADVYATVPDSDVTVIVPKVIVLDGKSAANNVGVYTVKVQGDIASTTVINVEPQDEMDNRDGVNFEMSSEGKDNIPADVAQEKTTFSYADGIRVDVAASTHGTVTAHGMTAGQWNGDFVFNICASQVESEGSEFGEAIQMWDVSETADVDNVWMTYYQPDLSMVPVTYGATDTETGTTTKLYENGTVYITGEGKMEANIYNYFLSIEGYVQQVLDYYKAENGYNYRAEYDESTDDFNIAINSLKIYLDDEAAGKDNGSRLYDWDEKGFEPDLSDESLYKFIPETIIIDEGVTNVSDGAFSMVRAREVELPSTVKEIGEAAFAYCLNLSKVSLPDGLEVIGAGAFYHCSNLTNATIPSTVTSIYSGAFYGCGSVTEITIPRSVEVLDNEAFGYCTALETLVFEDGLTTIVENSFAGCSALKSITLSDTITTIERYAFEDCALTEIVIPKNVTSIHKNSFKGSGLTTIKGVVGSYVETYASTYNYDFISV